MLSDYTETEQRQLHHIWHVKTDCLIKHDEKNHWDCNDDAAETNNKAVWHAVRTSDEKLAKLIHRDSSRSTDRSDAQDLKSQKLCDITAHTEHYQSLQQSNMQVTCSHLESKKNIEESSQMSAFLHDEQNHNINAERLQNQENTDKYENSARVAAVAHTLLVLCSWASWSMQ